MALESGDTMLCLAEERVVGRCAAGMQGDGAGLKVVKRVSILCSNSLISSFLCCLSSPILYVMVLIAVAVILDCATTFVRLFSRPVSLDDSPAKSPDIFTVSSSSVFTCSTEVSFCF